MQHKNTNFVPKLLLNPVLQPAIVSRCGLGHVSFTLSTKPLYTKLPYHAMHTCVLFVFLFRLFCFFFLNNLD